MASTESANPMSTANSGAMTMSNRTVADSAGRACRRRLVSSASNAIAPITAARRTLAVGSTITTKPASVTPASTDAARGPISPAASSTAPHTMATFAPDTAVRWVKPAVRNVWAVVAGIAAVSPSTRAGSIAAASGYN